MSLADFIFSRLYVQGSLRQKAEGTWLTLRNTVAPAVVTALTKVEIDGRRFTPCEVTICQGGGTTPAAEITDQRPLVLDLGAAADILIPGGSIGPGAHTVTIGAVIRGVGEIAAKVTDRAG